MKKNKLFTTVVLLGFLGTILTGCAKKEGCTDPTATNYDPDAKKNCCCVYAPVVTDIASKIIGNYIGSGDMPSTYYMKTIKITKVSNTRIKIEPLTAPITAFEVNIMEVASVIKATDAEEAAGKDFEVVLSSTPYVININCDSPEQDFGGTKQ